MRTEADGILGAIDEAIRISREARISVEIWHLKVAGKQNWGRMPEVIAKINAARAQGVDLAADTYAYTAWGNGLASFIPPWAHDGGDAKMIARLKEPELELVFAKTCYSVHYGWQNQWHDLPGPEAILVGVVQNPKLLPLQGKTLAQIAVAQNKDPLDALFDLLIEDNAFTLAISFGMSEPDVVLALRQRPGFRLITITKELLPTVRWAKIMPIRVHMELSHASCANTFARRKSSRSKMPSANFRHCRRNGCGWAIAACSSLACGLML